MATFDPNTLPFSQREGMDPIPPQLALGEVSEELRRLIHYAVHLEIQRESKGTFKLLHTSGGWRRLASDLHVIFFKGVASDRESIENDVYTSYQGFLFDSDIGNLFNFLEFLIQHPNCSAILRSDLEQAFIRARAAYRITDGRFVIAVGTGQQASAVQAAILNAGKAGATSAKNQLLSACIALKNGDWAGCIRDSIHAVEAVAVSLAPDQKTLGAALSKLESRGRIHASLKLAFSKLYGYASDEEGVRHALVYDDVARVDEADALFMLGACASFVSYLLARCEL